jgi:IS30 family transposase
MKKTKKYKFKQFSFEERVKIETLLEEKKFKKEIARKLKRDPGAIRYEIKKNSVRGKYRALKAELKSYQRKWRSKFQVLKIATNKVLKEYVEEHIKRYWSPEGIAGRLKCVETNLPYVGKDAIYSYIESVHGRPLEKYLWWKGKKFKPSIEREIIPNRTMIDKRPKSVDSRVYFGDWEGDFIVSGKGGSGALLVLVERKSRYVIIWKLSNRKVATVNYILGEIFGGGSLVVRTLTLDNDISFRLHEEMSEIIGAPVFFCHPYHSWEKGTVEKINQMIRRFIKKGSDISKVTYEYILEVENILNNRPYECLKFKTPLEVVQRNAKLKVFIETKLKLLDHSLLSA